MEQIKSEEKVRKYLEQCTLNTRVQKLEDSTATAAQAAAVLGVEVAQIAKSIAFHDKQSGGVVVAVVRGDKKVDKAKIERLMGVQFKLAEPEVVFSKTGFRVGGVSPFGLPQDVPIVFDTGLLEYEIAWAAAGSPYCVVKICPTEAASHLNATIAEIVL